MAHQSRTRGNEAPIGVFDSGVGGLTILSALLRELPDERYVYFGDTGNCPYGVRTEAEIQDLAAVVARFLLAQHAKLIVVACNTASVAARRSLRAAFDVPIVVVVPAVKPAAEHTRTGVIGIASTEASARGAYLRQLIHDHARGVKVLTVGCPRLVALAEAGQLDGPETEAAVREYMAPLLAAGIDQLVLGCTHFPAMRAVFERVAGPGVAVIDSGVAVAQQTRRRLAEAHLLAAPEGGPATAPRPPRASDAFWCSSDIAPFARVAQAILGHPVVVLSAPRDDLDRQATG